MSKKQYLDINSTSRLIEIFLNIFSKNRHSHTSEEINDLNEKVITVEGGASATLSDVFGSAPYIIEFTDNEESRILSSQIEYDNISSGLVSRNVQGAIDELKELVTVTVPGLDYDAYRLRNVAIVTEAPSIINDGDIALIVKRED